MADTVRAVTFDFHNTLVQCDEWFELEVRHIASQYLRWQGAQHGTQWNRDTLTAADVTYRDLRAEIRDHGRELAAADGVREVIRRLGLHVDDTNVDQGIAELMTATLETMDMMPGARETVEYLHSAGVRVGIVSSAIYHPFLVWSLQRLGLEQFFQTVVTSASAGFYKSRPEIFHYAAGELHVASDNVSHVGDSFRFDVLGARRAGMGTVWIQHPGEEPVIGEPAADLTLATLEGAGPAILQHLNQQSR